MFLPADLEDRIDGLRIALDDAETEHMAAKRELEGLRVQLATTEHARRSAEAEARDLQVNPRPMPSSSGNPNLKFK